MLLIHNPFGVWAVVLNLEGEYAECWQKNTASFVMSFLGSVCRLCLFLFLICEWICRQTVRTELSSSGVWCVCARDRHSDTPSCVPVCLLPSPEGEKLEQEGNPVFMPVQPLAFSPKAVSKGVNQCRLWQLGVGFVPPMHLLNECASRQSADGYNFHSPPSWAVM